MEELRKAIRHLAYAIDTAADALPSGIREQVREQINEAQIALDASQHAANVAQGSQT